jgi:uncharacterized protein YndB with AHSA1/START domain
MAPIPDRSAPLVVRRLLRAPLERVFAAWTTPADLTRWFGPRGWTVVAATVDLRPGGCYQFQLHLPAEDATMTLRGLYREVAAQSRLCFTWRTEGAPISFGVTLVTVDFAPQGGHTEVRITHDGFKQPEIRDGHGEGWNASLDNLAALLAAEPPP